MKHSSQNKEQRHFRRTVSSTFMVLLGLAGLVIGAILGGWLGSAMATGALPVAGLGQIAASGTAPAIVALGGIGAAVGGFAGAFAGLLMLPRRDLDQQQEHAK